MCSFDYSESGGIVFGVPPLSSFMAGRFRLTVIQDETRRVRTAAAAAARWSSWAIALVVSVLAVALGGQAGVMPAPAAASAVEEPSGYRMDDYRSPVPQTLAGAEVLTAERAEDLWRNHSAVFIDVYPKPPKPPNLPAGTFWRDPVHQTMDGAHWVPNVGYGALPDDIEAYFKRSLDKLSGGDRGRLLVFFCQKDCWMSWNAAKRALSYGYRNVAWFRDGTDAWQELGYPLVKAQAEP